MLSSKALRHLAACSISLPTAFAVSPKLAKETIYMPSQVAAKVLGNALETRQLTATSEESRPSGEWKL